MKLQAYNPEWAFHTALRGRAARWKHQQLLSATQLTTIEAAYPLNYYRPLWPLRVGLFVFACFGLVMAGGFAFLITGESAFAAGVLYCAACLAMLELVIRERRLYHCGADNALLYSGLSSAGGLIFYVFSAYIWPVSLADNFTLANGYLALPLLLLLTVLVAATLRYADAFVMVAAVLTTLLLVAIAGLQSSLGQALLPFLMMATAAGVLALYRTLARRVAGTILADYYATCLLTLKVLALAVFYLGGNYLVVREGNAELHHLPTSVQVPFAIIFYALTAGIPFVYIILGLRRADRSTLLVGLLTLVFSLYTLRNYRSLMPPEVAAVVAGVVLTLLAGTLLRILRPARFSFTSLPDDEPRHFNLENLIQAQTAHASATPAPSGFGFGGGHSGGGGATGHF